MKEKKPPPEYSFKDFKKSGCSIRISLNTFFSGCFQICIFIKEYPVVVSVRIEFSPLSFLDS